MPEKTPPVMSPWLLADLLLAVLAFAGCGMFNASGQVGPDLKPHLGAGVSIPLGK